MVAGGSHQRTDGSGPFMPRHSKLRSRRIQGKSVPDSVPFVVGLGPHVKLCRLRKR